jgi:hypothetical protein
MSDLKRPVLVAALLASIAWITHTALFGSKRRVVKKQPRAPAPAVEYKSGVRMSLRMSRYLPARITLLPFRPLRHDCDGLRPVIWRSTANVHYGPSVDMHRVQGLIEQAHCAWNGLCCSSVSCAFAGG